MTSGLRKLTTALHEDSPLMTLAYTNGLTCSDTGGKVYSYSYNVIINVAQIHLFCGDQLLGSCDVPVDVLTRQLSDNSYSQPVSISDFYMVSYAVDIC